MATSLGAGSSRGGLSSVAVSATQQYVDTMRALLQLRARRGPLSEKIEDRWFGHLDVLWNAMSETERSEVSPIVDALRTEPVEVWS